MPYVTMTSGPCPQVMWYGTTGTWITSNGWADPWYAWNQTRTWTTNTTTGIWSDWQSPFITTPATSTNIVTFGSGQPGAWAVPAEQVYRADGRPVFTEDQRTEAEWAEMREIQDIERRIRDRANVEARANAHKLLAMVLTEQQLADYAANRHFDVIGSEGGLYRIHHGTSGNIRRLIDGREVNRLCVHPRLYDHEDNLSYLPTEDCLAAQALALMHDERTAVMTANVHQGVRHLQLAA